MSSSGGPSERCENCGGMIGRLETPMVWKDHRVCPACYARLDAQEAMSMAPPAVLPMARAVREARESEPEDRYDDGPRSFRLDSDFSVVRVLGMLILLAGIPLTCIFLPVGLPLLIVGAVLVIVGR